MSPDTSPALQTLDAVEAALWRLLERGARDRRADAHTPVLASVDAQGRPQARTVVLRGVDRAAGLVWVHTDARGAKVGELTARPDAQLVVYDRTWKTQARLSGIVSVHRRDAVAEAAWAASTLFARRCYLAPDPPGSPADGPISGLPADVEGRAPSVEEAAPAFDNFAVLRLTVARVDWLHLAHTGHRRARFERTGEGGWLAAWAVP